MNRLLPALLVGIALAGCAPTPPVVEKVQKKRTHLSAPPSAPLPRIATPPTTAEKVQALLGQGDSLGALTLVRAKIDGGEGELALADPLVLSVNAALAEAERMFARGEFDRAGHLYRQLDEGFPRTPSLVSRIAVSSAEVQMKIRACADRLMAEGLKEYRQGRLEGAVETWNQILEFDPKNMVALRAIETASRQLHKLRTLD